MSGTLDDRLTWRTLPAEEQGDTEQVFASCQRNFRRRAVCHDIDKRDDARRGEIKELQCAARCVYDLAEGHRNALKTRQQSFVDGWRQGREQMILPRSRRHWHCPTSHLNACRPLHG